jgi:hypothetical protein
MRAWDLLQNRWRRFSPFAIYNIEVYSFFYDHGFTSNNIKLFRAFHDVLSSLQTLHLDNVRQPVAEDPVPSRISKDPKMSPYFDNCLGALDGTHINAYVQGESTVPFRNRKGALTQNVLAVCTFDLQFCYVLAGWEGSAHDARVLNNATSSQDFEIPTGKYYLGDAGYSNSRTTLTPYRGVRYHLQEQMISTQKSLPLPSTRSLLIDYIGPRITRSCSTSVILSSATLSSGFLAS